MEHIVISDLVGNEYARVSTLSSAYTAAKLFGRFTDLLVVTNESNGRVAYFKAGQLSVYVKDGVEDWSKVR